MTDLKNRFAAMLSSEPSAVDDLDSVLARGRRIRRRRMVMTSAGATVGTAAVTAAVVVPLTLAGQAASGHRSTPGLSIADQPSPSPTPTAVPACKTYFAVGASTDPHKIRLGELFKQAGVSRGAWTVEKIRTAKGGVELELCPRSAPEGETAGGATSVPTPTVSTGPTTPPAPRYHYTAKPTEISSRLGGVLADRVDGAGLQIVHSEPFAQETSTLAPGHPSYFNGNVDVTMPNGLADIGVTVRHDVTTQAPFTGACDPATCQTTTLSDGSVEQVTHLHVGHGMELVAVEVHRPNGLEVEAQSTNYAFGPEATKTNGSGTQPLPVAQLAALAEDPAFTF